MKVTSNSGSWRQYKFQVWSSFTQASRSKDVIKLKGSIKVKKWLLKLLKSNAVVLTPSIPWATSLGEELPTTDVAYYPDIAQGLIMNTSICVRDKKPIPGLIWIHTTWRWSMEPQTNCWCKWREDVCWEIMSHVDHVNAAKGCPLSRDAAAVEGWRSHYVQKCHCIS